MKKLIIGLAFVLMGGSMPVLGQTAKECFKSMPDSLMPLLTPVNRADFIDFLESDMRAEVTNRFNRKSEMTRLTDDYIRIQMTERSSWQMKVLPLNDSVRVVCTVATVQGPVADSDVQFYTTDWKLLPADTFLHKPCVKDFVTVSDTLRDNRIRSALAKLDMCLTSVELSGSGDILQLTFTTPRYLDAETADLLKPYIRPMRKYVWRDGRYRPVTSL